MRVATATPNSLFATLWPRAAEADAGAWMRGLLLALAGSALLTISAKLQVPFWPVPMTMQTFVVLVLGMTLGPRLAALAILTYLAEGAFGLPVFANTPERGLGLAYMAGPTGGYLAGFLASAVLVGWLAERGWDRSFLGTAAAMLLGTAVIFGLGLAWLSGLIGLEQAIASGLVPFLPAAALKIALATATLPLVWRALNRREGDRRGEDRG